MTREAIYDEQINPLMAEIISICVAHDIPLVASFQINDDRGASDEDPLMCSTILLKGVNVCGALTRARDAITGQPQGHFATFRITKTGREENGS